MSSLSNKLRLALIDISLTRARISLASTSLSSITSGRATYGLRFSEYQQVPPDVQTALLKAYEELESEED